MSPPLKYILITCFLCVTTLNVQSQHNYFIYSSLPDLPANSGMSVQPGFAGPYAGIDDDVLILAGGANFSGKLPWEGGKKVYYNEIFILQKLTDGTYSWSKMEEQLPLALAYGGAVSTPKGLLCFGGNTSENVIAESWLLNYFPESGKMGVTPGPKLPLPLSNSAYSMIGDMVYLAGGISENGQSVKLFFRLDISGDDPLNWRWEKLPAWNGRARAYAVGATQSNGISNCFYLFSGREIQNDLKPEILYDAHVYDPSLNTWSEISDSVPCGRTCWVSMPPPQKEMELPKSFFSWYGSIPVAVICTGLRISTPISIRSGMTGRTLPQEWNISFTPGAFSFMKLSTLAK